MYFSLPLLGFGIGLLVGLTGMGGGALMTPALILLGLARPAIAVGTDLAWGTITKAVGSLANYQQKTIDFTIVRRLALGSIPGALAGLLLLAQLHSRGTEAMDRLLLRLLAIALICVSLTLFARTLRGACTEQPGKFVDQRSTAGLTSLLGALIGFLVSLTSVGSGSLIVASLLVLYPTLPVRRIVGSDILHAFLLVGISTLGHLKLGNIDFLLLVGLLVGSIPGVWFGGRMSAVLPERILQPILATALFVLGYKLL